MASEQVDSGHPDFEASLQDVVGGLMERIQEEIAMATKEELERRWYFTWDPARSLEWNTYTFHKALIMYGDFCRQWEEHHNGRSCVVERVRDQYLMPKIKLFVVSMLQADSGKVIPS